ncbi:hypothetical protein DAEQUDRAFT_328526 [Daedalea quercina L-15889]|uniref:Uncharacterized protein n=1 Tax=Daedalea quercina L-15889 TaxID=1314783 RepID=A0A165PQ16_9APHY|nr:hypothetical protein DAEQUDRAFT_328526 [Daedalea quercina L-15889]
MAPLVRLVLLGILASFVAALNDWTKACLNGECSYDVAGTSLYISGSQSAISDLTPAAGWQILDCDSNSTTQDIRAVCSNPTASCEHLFQGGAVGTIVRLPENCTAMPFARVAQVWDHENQTRDVLRFGRFYTRGAYTNVKGISLDTNFSAINVTQNGNVAFAVRPSNNTGVATSVTSTTDKRRTLGVEDNITKFNQTVTSDPATITFDNQTILLDTAIPALSDGQVTTGVEAAGTLVPPQLTEFGLTTNVNGMLDGTLQLNTSATGTFTTGSIPLFQVGIPGLDIPGILSIGPTFQIDAKATLAVEAGVGLDVDFAFNADNLELYFPPTSTSSSGDISNATSNAQVNLIGSPDVTSNTNLTLDLIPGISFGVTSLDGVADATISLNLDNFIEVDLTLTNNGGSSSSNSTSNSTESAVSGSVNVDGGFNVVASADASLFGLLDAGESITLFSKNFELFQDNF